MFRRQEHGSGSQLEEYLAVIPRLSDKIRDILEEPISVAEIELAIDELGPNKSPGLDGLTAALYKTYKNVTAGRLFAVIIADFETKRLPSSFLNTYSVLITKVADQEGLKSIKDYRPVPLNDVDYKVLMKIVARRLQNVICEIRGKYQICGIPGRSIRTNVHIARSILELCDENFDQVAMLQIDLKKTFDRVQHHVMYKILDHVQVGGIIRGFVQMAYIGCVRRK